MILILLLLITLYSYYCLSSRMVDFERKRLEYILNKENELKNLEKKIKVISNCSEKNEKYQQAIKNINIIIDELNLPPGSICLKSNDIIKSHPEHLVKKEMEMEKEKEKENNLKIINEVPITSIINYGLETKSESETKTNSESENFMKEFKNTINNFIEIK